MAELNRPEGKLHYSVHGNGTGVLLLHPVGLDGTWWSPFAERLARTHRVVQIDFRGHGRSAPVGSSYEIVDLAADAAAVLADSGLASVHVVGLSYGGMVAQHLALDWPQLVRSLVLCGTAATLSAAARATVADRGATAERLGMASVIEETLSRWFTPEFRNSELVARCAARLLNQDVGSWAAAWQAISRLDTLPRLGTVRVPTMVLTGEKDVAAPPEVARGIAEAVPGARLVLLPDAPHMAPFEQREPFESIVMEFLEKADLAKESTMRPLGMSSI